MVNIVNDRVLDWKPRFDERSRGFQAVAGIEDRNPITRLWDLNIWLDQGQEGACVGFGHSHEQGATPEPVIPVTNDFAFGVYNLAKTLDDWPGENYDGTSVLAGAKALSQMKRDDGQPYIQSYEWAFGIKDVVLTLSYKGGVVLGVNWYNAMFDTDADGFIHGRDGIAGGHCIYARGVVVRYKDGSSQAWENVDMENSYVVLHNSWGPNWGTNGEAKITLKELDALLQENGEACKVTKSPVAVVPTPQPEPQPEPTPEPTPTPSEPTTLSVVLTGDTLVGRVTRRAAKRGLTPDAYVTERLDRYFNIADLTLDDPDD